MSHQARKQATLKTIINVLLASQLLWLRQPNALISAQQNEPPKLVLSSEKLDKPPEVENAERERLTIVAPRALRPQSDYHILVSLARSRAPATIELTITGGRDSNRELTDAKSVLAQSGETQTVKFHIGDWPSAEYFINVSAQAVDRSWNFTAEKELKFEEKKFSIMVQTDKAIYKPGDELKFRAVFLDPKLNPIQLNEEINITISDPRRNLVKQWLGQSNKMGLISQSMALSQDPMMGEDWTIRVEARNQVAIKKFQVAEYVLPTFDVNIELPPYATYNESDIIATVRATYTYGKPVDGHVSLTVQPKIRYFYVQTRPLDSKQYKSQLDPVTGKADFAIDLMRDLWIESEHYEREIEFFALVEDKLTGRKYNKTQTMFIYEKPIKVELVNNDRSFKPGLPHLFQFRVSYQDGKPVEDMGPEMSVRFVADQQLINMTRLRPMGGYAEYWLDIPRLVKREPLSSSSGDYEDPTSNGRDTWLALNYLEVQVMYRNQLHGPGSVSGHKSKSGEYMALYLSPPNTGKRDSQRLRKRGEMQKEALASKQFNVGDDLRVQVRSTEPMALLTCQGLARGDIVWVVTREPRNETQLEFSVKLDQRMTPHAKVLCFYVRYESRELITDFVSFPVNGLLRNPLKLSLSKEQAKPHESVEISALSKPNSLIGLLAVDESVVLLKSGNDFSLEDLKRETESYGGDSSSGSYSGWGASNAERIFSRANVVVLTNNKIYNGWEFERVADEGAKPGSSNFPMQALAVSSYEANAVGRIELSSAPLPASSPSYLRSPKRGRLSNEPIVIRSEFPETWLWENATTGSDGKATFSATVPDTITSWRLTGFSINDEFGFGLSSPKTSLRVFRPFFIKLNLPYSIIRGETVNIQCVVFNYGPRPVDALVSFDNSLREFDFIEASNEIDSEPDTNNSGNQNRVQQREIRIEPEQGASVSFLVRPKRLGYLTVHVVARSETSGDGVVHKLLVKPEGQTQFMNRAILLHLPGPQSVQKKNFSIEIPPNAVPGSEKVSISAIGDVMGAGLANVDDLLRLPYGCGEQNMINLVPNIVILNYLTNTRRIKETQKLRALRNIETGYQRELNYKRRDGSFSAFGESDKNGSVWLTAYVLKTFQQARSLIKIDPNVIHRAANYIAHYSQTDGSIRDHGMIHDKRLQSSASSSAASLYLTAYSMIALLQDPGIQNTTTSPLDESDTTSTTINEKPIDEVIQRGLNYLESKLESGSSTLSTSPLSTYDMAILTYTLQLAGRQASSERAYKLLMAEVRHDQRTGGQYWSNRHLATIPKPDDLGSAAAPPVGLEFEKLTETTPSTPVSSSTIQPPLKPIPANPKHSAHLFLPESLSIEITALGLLTMVRRGELEQALPFVKWLVGQQNSNGGFASTQDTVLAIEALGAFASASVNAKTAPTSIDIEIVYPKPTPKTTKTNNSTAGDGSQQRSRSSQLVRRNVEQMLISSSNELVNQQLPIHSTMNSNEELIKWVSVQATGTGSGVIQVSWQYNLLVSAEQPAFYLNPYVDRTSNINYLQLSICTYYKQAGESSNMAVLDVELPSGYLADLDSLPSLRRNPQVKRVDTSDGDTKVLIYLDKVTNEEFCLTVPAHRGAKVSNNKPVPVTIYDYYDRHKAARIFYEPILARSCDICDSDSCSKACSRIARSADGFVSLHEQRKRQSNVLMNEDIKQGMNGSESRRYSNILPLAPVMMTLVSLFRRQ